MSEQEVKIVELLQYMHAISYVRGDETHRSVTELAQYAVEAGYWCEAFQPILYDRGTTLEEIRTVLSSHIAELGGTIDQDLETAERLELSHFFRMMLRPKADVLAISYRLFEDLNHEWACDGSPRRLHMHDLALEYYTWAYDYADWMEGQEYADKKYEVETNMKRLAQEWLDQHAVPSPFDRL